MDRRDQSKFCRETLRCTGGGRGSADCDCKWVCKTTPDANRLRIDDNKPLEWSVTNAPTSPPYQTTQRDNEQFAAGQLKGIPIAGAWMMVI